MNTTLASKLNKLRTDKNLKIKDLYLNTGIDAALLSKFESATRIPTKEQIEVLSTYYDYDLSELETLRLSEKIYKILEFEDFAVEAMMACEPRIEYLRQIKSKELTTLSANIHAKLATLDAQLIKWNESKHIQLVRKQKMEDYFNVKYTYESNKIEGNTLTLSETMMVVKEGITISGKSMNEHLEAINHSEAISLIYDLVSRSASLNEYHTLQLHALILRGINSTYAGKYRNVNVRITGSDHIPPEPYLVPKLMEDYFQYYLRNKSSLHPVILAAEMHERLVSIHPFIDGNGRTARLIMNLILLSSGYPIAILKGDLASRRMYYAALEKVQIHNEPELFYHLVIDRLYDSLVEHLALCE